MGSSRLVIASASKLENIVVKGPLEDVVWFWVCADEEIRAVSRAALALIGQLLSLSSVCPWSSTSYCSCKICSHGICRIIRI